MRGYPFTERRQIKIKTQKFKSTSPNQKYTGGVERYKEDIISISTPTNSSSSSYVHTEDGKKCWCNTVGWTLKIVSLLP